MNFGEDARNPKHIHSTKRMCESPNKSYHKIFTPEDFYKFCDTISPTHSFLKYFVTDEVKTVSIMKNFGNIPTMTKVYQSTKYDIFRGKYVLNIYIK